MSVSIIGLEYSEIRFNLDALDSIRQLTFDDTNFFVSAYKMTLIQVKLERSYILPELTFSISDELVIENVSIIGPTLTTSPKLGY